MGRIVYFSLPGHGHINPTLPVIRELVRRQHQVVYYGTEQFRQAIQCAGALFQPYSVQFHMPDQGPGPFAQVSTTLEALLDLSRAVLEDHLEEVWALHPTQIMYDSFAPWGGLVARILQLPLIASIRSILVNGDIDSRYRADPQIQPQDPRLTAQWYAEFRARCHATLSRYCFPEPPSPPQLLQTYGDLNVVYTSRLFQPSSDAFDEHQFQFVGLCSESRSEAPAFPFDLLDDRPLVLVSLGTAQRNHPHFFRLCLEELADTPWRVVLSTGSNSHNGHLGPVPENSIVRSFVPQMEILRRCAAFVTHAGMNSVQEALCWFSA
jgi:MGT family glycosyltransferase